MATALPVRDASGKLADAERIDALRRLDVDWYLAAVKGTIVDGVSREALLVQLHKARIDLADGATLAEREASRQWLRDNGKEASVGLDPREPLPAKDTRG